MFSRLAVAPRQLRVGGARLYSGFFSSSKPPGGLVKPTSVVKRTPSSSSEMTQQTTATNTNTTSSAPTPSEAPSLPSPTPIPRIHPSPVLATMHLHSFFSLDRPMLLLSQPTSRLFTTEPPKRSLTDDPTETDSDADAARNLSHALVMSRVQSAAIWADTLTRLGVPADPQDAELVSMDSVKRKRRKKITKHKYKKRRKLQRSERRRLGK
ncbi:unnamed protein product [Rhizoctonia solani]|uniref:Small ribosomal subunit protein mS38 n=1 Tax=Rhizoctonia solani TaxID=456999 RepID=A0A8H2XYF7_9AGAM|nr:unnamed protein product [Rhizoctonia solani]